MKNSMLGILSLLALSAVVPANGEGMSSETRLKGVMPQQQLRNARLVSHHNSTAPLSLTVGLKLRDPAGLEAFLKEVQDPSNPSFHHFLKPSEVKARFSPTDSQVQAVVRSLQVRGLRVTGVMPDNMGINVVASTTEVERAFKITINDYQDGTHSFFANAEEPSFDASVAGYVQSVLGLDDAVRPHSHASQTPAALTSHAGNGTHGGFSPRQIATAYNWPSITDTSNGTGVTIAVLITGATNFSKNDATTFWNDPDNQLPSHSVTYIPVSSCQSACTYYPDFSSENEVDLDVEMAGAMAPGASILVYDGENEFQVPNSNDLFQTLSRAVNDNRADVITISEGFAECQTAFTLDCALGISPFHGEFEFAAAEGISVVAASGDNTSTDNTSLNMADYPSSDPYVLAAGGTSLTLSSGNAITSETAWSGTGGAASAEFSEPWWQTGTGVPQAGVRETTDMAMNADTNGSPYEAYVQGNWGSWGGTSLVAPQLAALFADAISQNGGTRLGEAPAIIYGVVNAGHYASDFNDVTTGSNGFSAKAGWDHPTGWGSPNGQALLADIVAFGPVETNHAPVAHASSLSATENKAATGTLTGTDADGDILTYSVTSGPSHGKLSFVRNTTYSKAPLSYTYTPNANYVGSDSFKFDVQDDGITSNIATVSINVAVAYSAPSLDIEYFGCNNKVDSYTIFWNLGSGSPTRFQLDYAESSPYYSLVDGSGAPGYVKFTILAGQPFSLRARDGNGISWSAYTIVSRTADPCLPVQ